MTNQTKTNNLHYFIDPTFNNVNRLFVLLFEYKENETLIELLKKRLQCSN